MKTETSLYIIVILLVSFFFFILGYNSGMEFAYNNIELMERESNYLFLCDSFNDGRDYSQEPCEDLFINITGNYCNGKMVCQNTLKKEVQETKE